MHFKFMSGAHWQIDEEVLIYIYVLLLYNTHLKLMSGADTYLLNASKSRSRCFSESMSMATGVTWKYPLTLVLGWVYLDIVDDFEELRARPNVYEKPLEWVKRVLGKALAAETMFIPIAEGKT